MLPMKASRFRRARAGGPKSDGGRLSIRASNGPPAAPYFLVGDQRPVLLFSPGPQTGSTVRRLHVRVPGQLTGGPVAQCGRCQQDFAAQSSKQRPSVK